MKQVQIDDKLFCVLCAHFLLEQELDELDLEYIRDSLTDKLNRMVDRQYFTDYKRAATPEEREKYRQRYLDRREISKQFRTDTEIPSEKL